MDRICPCQSGASFDTCCAPLLRGEAYAETAEALMRSRYSAFCKGEIDYLFDTHHPNSRSPQERAELQASVTSTEWTYLQILATQKGLARDSLGVVEFVAACRPKRLSVLAAPLETAEFSQMHERSRFLRENGRWFYVDGDQLPPYRPARGEKCWCGSGKKAKICHR